MTGCTVDESLANGHDGFAGTMNNAQTGWLAVDENLTNSTGLGTNTFIGTVPSQDGCFGRGGGWRP